MAKGKKTGGRAKGVPNKRNFNAEEIAARFNLDPLEVLLMVVNADWKGLGFAEPSTISYSPAGIEFEKPAITLPDRIAASKEAAKYLYSTKQAVALSNPDGSGIKIEIVDYTSKGK